MAVMTQGEFLQHFVQNAPRMMWFLGAGTSRTAGMPTATDIIWDLKRKYYCRQENQDFQAHDINNKAVRARIQTYMDGKGFPSLWSPEEYSFYFELCFGKDYGAQQKYIADTLSSDKLSLNIGHRALAALLAMGQARVVFTTNFDQVIESAYASVAGNNLSAFHLEGAYAALDALNAEQFPLYAKIHGDFRYQSIKNLSADLLSNDAEIRRCFLAASSRYGLVVSGYSGRDANVRAMFSEAMEQNNAFPNGLFWAAPKASDVSETVKELIEFAEGKGIRAYIVEAGTFDEMLSRIWRQVSDKPAALAAKVRATSVAQVSIPLPAPGTEYPILRTNGLPVLSVPTCCGYVKYAENLSFANLKDRVFQNPCDATITYIDKILFWGADEEIYKVLERDKIEAIENVEIEEPVPWIAASTFAKAFFEEGLCRAVCADKPLVLRKKGRTYFAVVSSEDAKNDLFLPLRQALAFKDKLGAIAGTVRELKDVTWAESVALRLEERNGALRLLLRPDIWISPLSSRYEAADFLRTKRRYRYNPQSSAILDAWIKILLGSMGSAESVKVCAFVGKDHSPTFEIGTRTGYSRRIGGHG